MDIKLCLTWKFKDDYSEKDNLGEEWQLNRRESTNREKFQSIPSFKFLLQTDNELIAPEMQHKLRVTTSTST